LDVDEHRKGSKGGGVTAVMPLKNQDLHADLFTRQQRKTSNYFVRGAKGKASRQQSTSLMMQLPTSGTADIQVKVKTRKAAL